MNKYEKLKQKYNILIKQKLEENKSILIDSFVEFYGEEFRALIERKYNEIVYCYYLDWDTINLVVEQFIPQVNNKSKYADFINFYNCHKKRFFKNLFGKKKEHDDLPDNLIGTTDLSVFDNEHTKNDLTRVCGRATPVSWNYGSIRKMRRFVAFQILALNEISIIHEINHALTSDNLAYVMDENTPIGLISKAGLSIDVNHNNSGERNTEELLNEKASIEIANIFKRKGGNLSSFCLDIPLEYAYEANFYLVDDFYETFKEYIKIARISDNKNALIKRIGETEYKEYLELINKYYSEDLNIVERNKKEALPKIKALIKTMKDNVRNHHDLNSTELETYYNQLREQGHTIKVLNNYENENLNYESDESIKR